MSTPMLPAVATLLVGIADGSEPAPLVSRPSSPVVHVRRYTRRAFTSRGVLHRGLHPLCGQRGRRWYRTPTGDCRPLCRRCAAAAERFATARGVTRQVAVERLDPGDIAAVLDRARTAADVSAAVLLACEAGLITKKVPTPAGPVLLTRLIHDARRRVTTAAASNLGPRDRNWADQVLDRPSARYHPRRHR